MLVSQRDRISRLHNQWRRDEATLAPYRVAQSAGHLRGMIAVLLPLGLWAFERSRGGSRWWLLEAGAAIASIPFSDLHLALGAVPFFLFYAVCRSRDRWTLAGALVGAACAVAAALLVSRLAIHGSIASSGRSLREVALYSATGLDFVSRHRRHGPESFVFLGWLTPLLAIAGLVVVTRMRRYGLALALAVGAVVPVVLALGTHFPLYDWLWHHFRPLRYPRVPERQLPVACLAIAALVAFAVLWITRRFSNLVTVCYLLVLVAVFVDLRLWVSTYRVASADPGNAAYAALRGLPLEPLTCGEWRPGADELLRRLGVRYVAFHGGLFDPAGQSWFAWRALNAHGWGELARGGAVTTFARARPASPPSVPEPTGQIVFCPEWIGRSPRYRHGAFWIRGAGRLEVRLESEGPDRTTITVDGASRSVRVAQSSRLRVPLRRGGWHLVGVDVRRADRHVRLISIQTTRR